MDINSVSESGSQHCQDSRIWYGQYQEQCHKNRTTDIISRLHQPLSSRICSLFTMSTTMHSTSRNPVAGMASSDMIKTAAFMTAICTPPLFRMTRQIEITL